MKSVHVRVCLYTNCCTSLPIFTTKYVSTCHMNIDIVYRNINMSISDAVYGTFGYMDIYSIMLQIVMLMLYTYIQHYMAKATSEIPSEIHEMKYSHFRRISIYLQICLSPSLSAYLRLIPFYPVWTRQRGTISIGLSPATSPGPKPWGMTQYSQN